MTKTQAHQHNTLVTAHTLTNLTDARCPHCHYFYLDGECMCSITETPPAPVVTNKAGNPYSVAWQSHATATVFHPGELEYYTVNIDPHGHYTCTGRSDGERCWPFYSKASCVHCEAVENSILLGEAPAYQAPVASKPKPKLLLEHLFDGHALTPAEKARETRFNKKTA